MMRPIHTHLPATVCCLLLALLPLAAQALSLADLSNKDAAAGLQAALAQGVDKAVAQLGANDGFLRNEKLAIPLPPALEVEVLAAAASPSAGMRGIVEV